MSTIKLRAAGGGKGGNVVEGTGELDVKNTGTKGWATGKGIGDGVGKLVGFILLPKTYTTVFKIQYYDVKKGKPCALNALTAFDITYCAHGRTGSL